jgi:hypothetical protein
MKVLALALAGQLALSGCQAEQPRELVLSAKFGVLFGGQIEERREVPFELDPTKQTLGFRIEFSEPLTANAKVEWDIAPPRAAGRGRAHAPEPQKPTPEPARASSSGTEDARAGETRFDHLTPFHPGDPLGLWNVRVVVRGKVVIDRPIEIYDAAARGRAAQPDSGL